MLVMTFNNSIYLINKTKKCLVFYLKYRFVQLKRTFTEKLVYLLNRFPVKTY